MSSGIMYDQEAFGLATAYGDRPTAPARRKPRLGNVFTVLTKSSSSSSSSSTPQFSSLFNTTPHPPPEKPIHPGLRSPPRRIPRILTDLSPTKPTSGYSTAASSASTPTFFSALSSATEPFPPRRESATSTTSSEAPARPPRASTRPPPGTESSSSSSTSPISPTTPYNPATYRRPSALGLLGLGLASTDTFGACGRDGSVRGSVSAVSGRGSFDARASVDAASEPRDMEAAAPGGFHWPMPPSTAAGRSRTASSASERSRLTSFGSGSGHDGHVRERDFGGRLAPSHKSSLRHKTRSGASAADEFTPRGGGAAPSLPALLFPLPPGVDSPKGSRPQSIWGIDGSEVVAIPVAANTGARVFPDGEYYSDDSDYESSGDENVGEHSFAASTHAFPLPPDTVPSRQSLDSIGHRHRAMSELSIASSETRLDANRDSASVSPTETFALADVVHALPSVNEHAELDLVKDAKLGVSPPKSLPKDPSPMSVQEKRQSKRQSKRLSRLGMPSESSGDEAGFFDDMAFLEAQVAPVSAKPKKAPALKPPKPETRERRSFWGRKKAESMSPNAPPGLQLRHTNTFSSTTTASTLVASTHGHKSEKKASPLPSPALTRGNSLLRKPAAQVVPAATPPTLPTVVTSESDDDGGYFADLAFLSKREDAASVRSGKSGKSGKSTGSGGRKPWSRSGSRTPARGQVSKIKTEEAMPVLKRLASAQSIAGSSVRSSFTLRSNGTHSTGSSATVTHWQT